MTAALYKLEVYVPGSHLEAVKQALFAAGAGQLGSYDSCCWQTEGGGQFRPLLGAKPHLGAIGQLEQVVEIKLELVCGADNLRQAVAAMLAAHPYEVPAYQVLAVVDLNSV
ncbi:NGG1p interacting factor NIF3 [Halioxenophilus sp. WMMB6]|uniref:NGG1p interacting factor NIF3 n=1 Tax=Halioxenophilus sp. WMMB6 TaxID=3073815 RepID=UPI00295F3B90|nr:NGG1p interacting factor NIF3 [Halioxenophilus sp. WMMB6]